jgi:hypothetical protein
MSVQEFSELANNYQLTVLWEKGKFISYKIGNGHKQLLYGLFDFFVVLNYDEYGNKIVNISIYTYFKMFNPSNEN